MATGSVIWPDLTGARHQSGDDVGAGFRGSAVQDLAYMGQGAVYRPFANIARTLIFPTGMPKGQDGEVILHMPVGQPGARASIPDNLCAFLRVEMGGTGDDTTTDRGYYVGLSGTALFSQRQQWLPGLNGATLNSVTLSTISKNTIWPGALMRAEIAGSTIRARVWNWGDAEPSGWDISGTNTQYTADGRFGVGWYTTNPGPAFGSFSVGVDEAAPQLYGRLSGVVQVNGTPQSGRKVRAVARNRPELVFETESAGDGTFSMYVIALGQRYTVYAQDLISGDYNAVVADKVLPV